MQPNTISQYTQPHQFEPLLPQFNLEPLRARSRAIIEQSWKLAASAHPDTIASLRELVREMNSYYSNRIEGQSTHPRNISRALHRDFSDKPDVARLQRIALAHIEAEKEMETSLVGREGTPNTSALSAAFVQKAHAALYGRLNAEDRLTTENQPIEPGQFRTVQVAVGRHEPPPPQALPAFLKRFDEAYARTGQLEDALLIAAGRRPRTRPGLHDGPVRDRPKRAW